MCNNCDGGANCAACTNCPHKPVVTVTPVVKKKRRMTNAQLERIAAEACGLVRVVVNGKVFYE